ncbi:merR family transcriptional regulator [Burkholderiales bacterium GJ-E10]|nr:merR family transcriptional regulator [Burkholderiales bacterium GJ-E10]
MIGESHRVDAYPPMEFDELDRSIAARSLAAPMLEIADGRDRKADRLSYLSQGKAGGLNFHDYG